MIAPARAARMTNAVSASYRSPSCGTRSSSERRMPRKPHWASRMGRPAHQAMRRVDTAFATRRCSGIAVPRRRRAPMTRSADSSALRNAGRQAASCWPSASIVMITATDGCSESAAAKPVVSAAPFPRFVLWRSTTSAPADCATARVASRDPSSTTMIATSGHTARMSRTTDATVSAA
jgi:hypothetical protein